MLTLRLIRNFCTANLASRSSCLRAVQFKSNTTPGKLAELFQTSEVGLRKLMLDPSKPLVDKQEAELLGLVYGYKINENNQQNHEAGKLQERTPVVTIMGHVDHGKTTLLDYLRSSKVADNEFGGITQKIGAFHVKYNGEKITFIDTPGHQAFVNMRLMGATVTDMIVLVVSAVEGVKPQTIEVIELAQKFKVPLIIAINKIDVKGADPELIEKQLIDHGLDLDVDGHIGEIPVVHISAKTGANVDLLAELILEQGKLYDIKSDYNGLAEGFILEANQANGGVKSATVVIKKGTIKPGSLMIAGTQIVKVRSIVNDRGEFLQKGLPGDAVELVGFKDVPECGALIFEVENETKAKYVVDKRLKRETDYQAKEQLAGSKIKIINKREKRLLYSGFNGLWVNKFREMESRIRMEIQELEEMEEKTESTEAQLKQKRDELKANNIYVQQYLDDVLKSPNTINIMLKTADRGTQETLLTQITAIKEELLKQFGMEINVLSSDVGDVSISDVEQGHLFNATILCFNSKVNPDVIKNTKQLCPIKSHKLIHTFLQEIKNLCIQRQQKIDGQQGLDDKSSSVIADTFKVSINKKEFKLAAGVKITEGKLCKKFKVKIFRNNKPISGLMNIETMKHFKKDVIELKKGDECTLIFDGNVEFMKGDVIKTYS